MDFPALGGDGNKGLPYIQYINNHCTFHTQKEQSRYHVAKIIFKSGEGYEPCIFLAVGPKAKIPAGPFLFLFEKVKMKWKGHGITSQIIKQQCYLITTRWHSIVTTSDQFTCPVSKKSAFSGRPDSESKLLVGMTRDD